MKAIEGKAKELLKLLKDCDATDLLEAIQDMSGAVIINACWINGSGCGYGNPNGRLDMASLNWCAGCQKLKDNFWLLENMLGEDTIIEMLKYKIERVIKEEYKEELKIGLGTTEDLLRSLAAKINDGTSDILSGLISVIGQKLKLSEIMVLREKWLEPEENGQKN